MEIIETKLNWDDILAKRSAGEFINKDDAIQTRLNAEVKYFREFAIQKRQY